MSTICVAPINNPVTGALDFLTERLSARFDTKVTVLDPGLEPRIAFDEARRQYNSTILLAELSKELPSPDAKVVGLTDADLYIPVLTFVFGEAQLDGNVAIVSSHRLHNSFYGLPDDRTLTLERLEKEVVHELGHTFSLTHCRDFNCVMCASSSVEEIDLKGPDFCRTCRARFR